jgi:hypothetical protein
LLLSDAASYYRFEHEGSSIANLNMRDATVRLTSFSG